MTRQSLTVKRMISQIIIIIVTSCFVCACISSKPTKPYNHQECMDTIPKRVAGLEVISGPRSEKSIIQDMVPVGCYARAMMEKKRSKGDEVNSGEVVLRVTVEYTGEVCRVEVLESTIGSPQFVHWLTDLVMDTDFVGWSRSDSDAVFIYPILLVK